MAADTQTSALETAVARVSQTLCLDRWSGGAGWVATGMPLAWKYIGTWQGLIGTDYGTMILIKVMLLVATLGFAGLNFWAARNSRASANTGKVFQRAPYYVENAIGMLAVIMACGRWLELRLTPLAGRLAGVASVFALLLIGLILLFYRETPLS
jgi:hypothetical protein